MPVSSTQVRNCKKGRTVYTPGGQNSIEWAANGDLTGEDIQLIDDEVLTQPQFQRMLNRGVLQIVTDDKIINAAQDAQNAAWQSRQAELEKQAVGVLDQQPSNDIIGVTCIGPSNRGGGTCGVPLPISEAKVHDTPPLCPAHVGLALEYIPETSFVDGKHVTTWNRFQMTPREYAN